MPPKSTRASAAKNKAKSVSTKPTRKRKALPDPATSTSAPKDNKKVKKAQNKVQDVKTEDTPELKKVTFSGEVPIDEQCPVTQAQFCVYKDDHMGFYNAMLNQTNIGENNNKYYVLQVLENKSTKLCKVWFRWGRVGKVAGTNLSGFMSVEGAKKMFEKKFRDKTKNAFGTTNFVKHRGQYDLLEMDYGKDEEEKKKPTTSIKKEEVKEEPSQLPQEVQDLIELIFDKNEFEESVKEMEFDVKKAPLGKLTTQQLTAGYESLKKIEDCINNKKPRNELMDACSEFYTKIPHDFGMKRPPPIETPNQLKQKLELLEALGDIQIAMKILDDESKRNKSLNRLDALYNTLDCDLVPVTKSDGDFKMVEKYVKLTHAKTHGGYTLAIDKLFKVRKDKNEKEFKKKIGNSMLLWHGSRLTNWCGILGQGLRIAPPEAPVSGYMFGKGVYFADMVSKSANYCRASSRMPYGMLLLCEVALGKPNEKKYSDYNAHKLPKGRNSTKGIGNNIPDKATYVRMDDGTLVPIGKEVPSGMQASLYYNEYIVYDVAQIRPRYLVKLKFNFKSGHYWW